MTNVVQFYCPMNRGNGARESVIRYFEEGPLNPMAIPMLRADHLLAALWVAGFKVVPLDANDEGDIRA